jgi:hypothetical protein
MMVHIKPKKIGEFVFSNESSLVPAIWDFAFRDLKIYDRE